MTTLRFAQPADIGLQPWLLQSDLPASKSVLHTHVADLCRKYLYIFQKYFKFFPQHDIARIQRTM